MRAGRGSDLRDGVGTDRGRRGILAWVVFGLALGIVGWGGFNTAMDATNSLDFCISCHEMRTTVHEEYRRSVHWTNPSGVRAVCADCHVPRDWTHKLVRKIQASGELWAKLAGTIDTPEKFEARRIDLARHEWRRMRASDSRECRNCHAYEAMDFHKQRPKSAEAMKTAREKGFTCIDCHKGIAHRLPDLNARHREMAARLLDGAPAVAVGATATVLRPLPLFAEAEGDAEIGRLAPLAVVTIRERRGERVAIETVAWQREGMPRTLHATFGRRIAAASLTDVDRAGIAQLSTRFEPEKEDTWTEVRLSAWTTSKGLVVDTTGLAAYGAELHEANCSFCHALPAPEGRTAETWISDVNAMRRMVPLDEAEIAFLLGHLQRRAKDVVGAAAGGGGS